MRSDLGRVLSGTGTRSVRVRRALLAVALVLVTSGGASACGSDTEESFVGADEVCGGVFDGPVHKTVESVMGSKSLYRTPSNGMDRVIEAIKDGYALGRNWAPGAELCSLLAKGAVTRDATTISFHIYDPRDVSDPEASNGGRLYRMGTLSEGNPRAAVIFFECVSPQLKGSKDHPARIGGELLNTKVRAGDPLAHSDDNLTVMHAVSLAVAKKLQCRDNGGLPDKPDLRPKEGQPRKA